METTYKIPSEVVAAKVDHRPRPLGGPWITPVTTVLAILAVIGLYFILKRFIFGLGAVANINNGFPWGIWIAWDVVIGTGLACGGYVMALMTYILNRGEYHPLVRPALTASLFGYSLGGLSVLVDLGRWWNFWHILSPAYFHPDSVMFEVAMCIAIYIMVMWIEFTPAFLEKWGMRDAKAKLNKAMPYFIALGVLLPTMHQSSLGSLLVVYGYQIHGLWQTVMLPLLFLTSAIGFGFAMVIFEAAWASAGFKRDIRPELPMLAKIGKILMGVMAAYLILRLGDLIVGGRIGLVFTSGFLSLMFLIEMALFAVPLVILSKPANRKRLSKLFIAACSMIAAGALYRIDAFLVAYQTGPGWNYFPSVPEIMVTVGLVAIEILAYIVFVRFFPVLPGHSSAPVR
ncbi:Ni/Fe-hydrogenase cytochrome b subunit [Magnetospirillum sp. UT-4]|uniref:Ni/Fe-hydrogenase cytochrome b subunit n=1 Tax=Magnetospirillum sp. UT-4 TaxID=2681467 RepID=UPI00137D0B51|nr:Ni/Fe-hydrogenase cytochrome b subunit [Magnetospirillum sp. UT-4]CAA7614316.1 hydrogenase 2 cytochrome b type component [Magnetospirillum sp. UT-4]